MSADSESETDTAAGGGSAQPGMAKNETPRINSIQRGKILPSHRDGRADSRAN